MGYYATIRIESHDDSGTNTRLERKVFLTRRYSLTKKKYVTDKAAARKALEQLLSVI